MKSIIIFFFILFLSSEQLFSEDSKGDSEYALGGGYTYFHNKTDKYLKPESGFIIRIQNGNGEAKYFSMISNLEFLMSGKNHADFLDKDKNAIQDVLFDLYLLTYSIGFKISTAPTSPIVPYFGLSLSGSIATLQFKNKTNTNFPSQQRGLMYGYDIIVGTDFFISGNKDNGWGLRVEGNMQTLFPINKFDCGRPQVQTFNGLLMFVTSM